MKTLLLLIFLASLTYCCGGKNPKGSDGYYIQKIAKEHPTWDADKCEDYLFMPKDSFILKYK